jgi:heat shock protein HtpX
MNRIAKTFILMACMTGLFLVAGQSLGGQQGMMLALFLALSMNFFAYWFSDKMALAMSGAREVTYEQATELHTLIGRLAEQARLPKPKVFIISNRTPNAFATGRSPAHSAVAVTEGLLALLNRPG